MKNNKERSKTIELFFRKMKIETPPENSDFDKFIDYVEKLISEKNDRVNILENCLNVSSEEIKNYTQELKEKSLQLSQSNKLAAIGEMSASLSHEINNPLFVISGNTEIIEKTLEFLDFKNKERVLKSLGTIKTTTTRIKKISDSLKIISNDKNDYDEDTVDLRDVIHESTILYLEQLKNNGIRFSINMDDENLYVKMAKVEFSQVIINLISNAKHAVESLEDSDQKFISIDIENRNGSVYIRVQNGGNSIPSNIQEKIFDSFFTTKPVGIGTGLGLSISRKIIMKMGGELSLDKESDHPIFIIKLPVKERLESVAIAA